MPELRYTEDDLLPISALQHLSFCARQCALIHVEGVWTENRLTAEGRILHERVHGGDCESRRDVRVARGLRLRSLNLGLTGVSDVVEFHRDASGVSVDGLRGRWQAFPVEYKRGKPKIDVCDEVQLCAQAVCLEEMLGCAIDEGALFYGKSRRRKRVSLDRGLRDKTEELARRLHELVDRGVTPPAIQEDKCRNCSLFEECLPAATSGQRSAQQYLSGAIKRALRET